MSFDPNAVSLKRAYDKNLITEVLPDDTILVFRGDNETNYQTYRLAYDQLLTLVGENSLFMGLFPTFNDLEAITGVSGNLAIVYDDVAAPVLYTWNASNSIWVELASGSGIDRFKGIFTDFDTLSAEGGNLGDYAYVESPDKPTRYDYDGEGWWFIPRTTNSYLGDFLDTNELPDGTDIVLNNDFATITKPYRPTVLYIASNDGNNVTWAKIGVANTDDLPEWGEPPTNLYFTTDRVLQSFARSTIDFTKPALSGGEQFISESDGYDQFKIFYFSTSVPCRFRLYVDSSLRDSDLTRDGVTPPTGNHGCIFDSSLNVANDVNCYVTPVILAMSDTGSNIFFYTIDTLGGGDIEVTVTLSIVVESNIRIEPD